MRYSKASEQTDIFEDSDWNIQGCNENLLHTPLKFPFKVKYTAQTLAKELIVRKCLETFDK